MKTSLRSIRLYRRLEHTLARPIPLRARAQAHPHRLRGLSDDQWLLAGVVGSAAVHRSSEPRSYSSGTIVAAAIELLLHTVRSSRVRRHVDAAPRVERRVITCLSASP